MKLILTNLILVLTLSLHAQELESTLYEGKMNDEMSISLFLKAREHECNTDIVYSGMYKYNGVSKWLQLDITSNDKMQFVLVEHGFTGLMILEKTSAGFEGTWISPDAKRQFKVALKKVLIPKEKMEEHEDLYEEVNYNNYDC